MIHRVVMDQRGQVDQLGNRRQRDGPRILAPRSLFGEQQEGGPEHLSLHLEKMGIDLRDKAEVGLDDASKLLLHALQPGPKPPLKIGQADRGRLWAHRRRPPPSFCIRWLRSRNRMSTIMARS